MHKMSDSDGGRVPTWNLADRLRKAREHAGFKRQEDMAATLHVSRSAVGNWETGENKPSYLALLRWAEVTDVPLEWLTDGTFGNDDGPGGADTYPVTLGEPHGNPSRYQASELIAA